MKKKTNITRVLSVLSMAVILLCMAWADRHLDAYRVRLLHMWGIYTIFAVTFNLVYGFTGQFSLGHAGLAAVGAYVISILTLSPEEKAASYLLEPPIWPISVIQWPFIPSLITAGVLAAVTGLLIGAPALRLRGDYLCIATLGFAEIIRLAFANLPSVTNGALGLKGIPGYTNLVWTWGSAILTMFVTKRLVDSSYGRALKAIREDEVAAEAVGVSLFYHKLIAFVASSFFVGIGGGLLAEILNTIDPNTFTSILTYAVITMVVLGGVGSITGSVIAAGIYTLMSELLRATESPMKIGPVNIPGMPGMRMLTFSIILLALILFYRRGLMGNSEFSWRWLSSGLQSLFAKTRGKEG